MQLVVNPHAVILAGENSFIRLSTDGGKTVATRCSHWRVFWTPVGGGHALFVDSPLTGGLRIYADSEPLVRFLQKEIEYFLFKPFGDTSLPVTKATFDRAGTPPAGCSESIHAGKEEVVMNWSSFLEPFNFCHDPGYDNRPLGVQTTFFPASAASFTVAGTKGAGEPWGFDRGGKPCTSACLAWCESWFRPK